MRDATARLNILFLNLEEWSKCSHVHSYASWDALAQISLKIIDILLDERALCRRLANTLGIILNQEQQRNTDDELVQLVSAAEENLEEGLRGFSKLLDDVLKDCLVRRNPKEVLQTVGCQRKKILELFNSMQMALEAYLDINEILGLNESRVAAAIFIYFLKQIYEELQKNTQPRADEGLFNWLDGRIRNEPLRALSWWISYGDLDISMINVEDKLAKERAIIFLCLRTIEQELVSAHEADVLDGVLFSLGMFGIRPFVEAGFLGVEQAMPCSIRTG